MSEIVESSVSKINETLGDDGFDGSIKVVIEDEGSFIIDENGARVADGDSNCTMHTDAETLQGIVDGSVNPTSAFMGGNLRIEGDMSQAMKLATMLG